MARCRFGVMAVLVILAQQFAWATEPQHVAQKVDEQLTKELFGAADGATGDVMARADDPTFLRRASLDLIGHPPTADDVTQFAFDTSASKRAAAVDRLFAKREFGENWARYWRDVIMYRRSEDRAFLASQSLVDMLSKAFNQGQHWDQIANKFVTATGDVREEGATALIFSQAANAEDTTAEISRIFLGIQIQCAQCHNHPTDRWKREQFHELAAFFPRMAVRPVREGEKRSFAVVSVNQDRKQKGKKPKRGALEHYMPDLNHPEADGTLMQPVFFVTGQKLGENMKDTDRRGKLAEWLTGGTDHWFAKAYVNRMWAELVGHGFYEPVDDIGPDRKCSAPQTVEYLAEEFTANGYDVKWLMRVITATEAYNRESRSRYEEDKPPFAASCPQRLRADQLYDTLATVLDIKDETLDPKTAKKLENNPRAAMAGTRGRVNSTFGYDPSVRRDEVAGSIPQALYLMNAPELNRALNGSQPGTPLGKLLADTTDDKAVVQELYLRCLNREPKASELQTCLEHVQTTGKRAEAFEDVLWSLINSTEFLNRK